MGQKNHATSWDQKKSLNLSGQKKSRNLRGQKKIPQPLGTKKVMQPLGEKNHATSLKYMSGHFEFVTVYLGLFIIICLVVQHDKGFHYRNVSKHRKVK